MHKFTSCVNGLNPVGPPFPVNVAARDPYDCPFAGHDRCDQNPSSQTVAVDDTDANHIYYAYAQDADGNANTSASNVIVQDSTDGGMTWTRPIVVASPAVIGARRIMPWMCTTKGDAVLTWFEQPDPVPSDRTDYFGARVGLNDTDALTVKDQFLISEVSDNWCNTGWFNATRTPFPSGILHPTFGFAGASESCPGQPQLAGQCTNEPTRCDFSDCGGVNMNTGGAACQCATGNTCNEGNGVPKYGDYNGNACVGGRLFAAWASRNQPPGESPPNTNTNTGVLFDVINLGLQDPLKCYFGKQTPPFNQDNPQLRFPIAQVELNDQFDSRTFNAFFLKGLCQGAVKNSPEPDPPIPDSHLTCYVIAPEVGQGPFFPPRSVLIDTENFGRETIQIGQPVELCIAAAKGGEDANGNLFPAPAVDESVGNFKCYRAKSQSLAPDVFVTLDDQFGMGKAHVGRLSRFCTPVGKNAPEPPDPEPFDHLACYDIEEEQPVTPLRIERNVSDQFIEGAVGQDIVFMFERPRRFCEPAEKLEVIPRLGFRAP